MTTKNSLSKALKKEGLRFTNQRQAVWDEIKSNRDYLEEMILSESQNTKVVGKK